MRSYFYKNPSWLKWIYPGAIYHLNDPESVFLTFDDGPNPIVTPYVLDLLDEYKAKATFFVIGENAKKHPAILRKALSCGHKIGNHTFTHMDGWKSSTREYICDIQAANEQILVHANENLFRPPYGNMKFDQMRAIKKAGYKTIMWSHLSGDFDPNLNISRSISVLKSAKPGSIMLFHDSAPAFNNLQEILPVVLDHYSSLGYKFKSL